MLSDYEQGFCEGLALGQKLPTMKKQPTSIPVTTIIASPESLRLRPGDIVYIYFTVQPYNATIQAVDCTSSNIEVVAVNRIDDLTFQVRAIESGSAEIKVVATDGYGATQTVNVAVLSDVIMETLKLNSQHNNFGDLLTSESLLVFEYTPIEAPGKNLKITLDPTLSGNQTPLKIEDTPFDNIKKIYNNFESLDLNDYKTKSAGIGWKAEATDGSGLQILNQTMNTGLLETSISGAQIATTLNQSIEVMQGYKIGLFSGYRPIQNLALPNGQVSIEIEEGDNLISIDNQYIVEGLSVGTAKVKVIINSYMTYNITINVIDVSTKTTSPRVLLVDELGQQQYSRTNGWYNLVSNKYRAIIEGGTGGKILSITPEDASRQEINGEWIIPKATGIITLLIEIEWNRAGEVGTEIKRTILEVYSGKIECGTATSNYLKKGIGVWVGLSDSINNYNVRNQNVVDIIVNGNEVRQIGYIKTQTQSINTITLNRDGASGGSSVNKFITVYVFEKLVSEPVTIRFQHHDFPDIFDEVTI